MTVEHEHYDILIAGGGMVGSSLAVALEPLGLRIGVVEANARATTTQHPSFDERSTALSRSTQRSFEAMGLWPKIVAASTPIQSIHVSDKGRFGFAHIDAAEQGVEALGYVCINRVLGGVLAEALDAASNVTLHAPARIVGVDTVDGQRAVRVQTADGDDDVFTTALLVVADGARSSVRDMLGIGAVVEDYGQTALIGNLLTELPNEGRAYERFTESGPIAMLPINNGRTAFVWILETSAAEALLELDDAAFTASLREAFGTRLGDFSRIGRRSSYPLGLSRALRLTAPGAVLVGNAAHGLHPVAAQGFNLGMRDVAALCDCIADALGDGAALGNRHMLEAYANWRKPDQQKLVAFTDGLVKLFGSERRAVRTLRNVGMLGFDLVPGVRRTFARHTMGLAGRLPRLSRGMPIE